MRKTIGGAVCTLMASAALIGGAAAADATPQTSEQASSVQTPQGWVYHDWYWTYGNCASNGGQLVARGQARNWRCDQSPYATFYLYLLY